MHNLPFKINRQDPANLTDQVSAGIRSAIYTGALRSGESLPPLLVMAEQLGVSANVVRNAVKSLAKDGLLCVRRRSGISVNNVGGHSWRASVLYVSWNNPTMYYHSVLYGVVADHLRAANVLVDISHVSAEEWYQGFPRLQADLTHPVSLAVVDGGFAFAGAEALLMQRGIPYIHFTLPEPSPNAVRAIVSDNTSVFRDVTDHCRESGISSALLVDRGNEKETGMLAELFSGAGVHCSTLSVRDAAGFMAPESVERGAIAEMDGWLEREKELPDLIWLNDDFVAQGALHALSARGIRIPEDVQVISWANRGLGPVFMKPLTRVEMDPVCHGEVVANCILDELDGKRANGKRVELAPVFIEGATTARKARFESALRN